MKPELPAAMTSRADQTDYRELLSSVFAMIGPEAGQIEWLLDRIEGNAEARRWA